jgi:DNA-binding response OmpR family regulator
MPVIVLTARGTLDARISGLDKGADDYLAKPFSPDELMARLRAVLRRNGSFQGREVVCANLSFDIDNQGLRIDGESVALSQREARCWPC